MIDLIDLIVPLGITTLTLVSLTVILGLSRRLKPRPILKVHKLCGLLALLAGATHATLVLWLH